MEEKKAFVVKFIQILKLYSPKRQIRYTTHQSDYKGDTFATWKREKHLNIQNAYPWILTALSSVISETNLR